MQIVRTTNSGLEIKTKLGTIVAENDQVTINNVKLLGPGEYEVAGIGTFGIGNKIYTFTSEDITIVYLYNITAPLSENEYAEFQDVSILVVPVGTNALDAKSAASIIKSIEPSVIIPVGDVPLNELCDLVGGCQEPIQNYKITKAQLDSQEGQAVIQLKPLK